MQEQLTALMRRMSEMEKELQTLKSTVRQSSGGARTNDITELKLSVPHMISSRNEITMSATRALMHQVVFPYDTDGLGNCRGGTVLSWIDLCAAMASKNVSRSPCVTASVDAVQFLRPCRTGDVAIIAAMVNRTFSSSMEVGVRVEAEDIKTGKRHHCCSAYLTFVSLRKPRRDGSGEKPLLEVSPVSTDQHRIYDEAAVRRQIRLEKKMKGQQDPSSMAREAAFWLAPIHMLEGDPTLPPTLQPRPEGDELCEVPPSLTTAHMTLAIMPQHANMLGITFGGQVMKWMEECAFISARRLGGGLATTAGFDSLAFERPTKVGHVMYMTSQVTAIFGTSMEVLVSVHGEDPVVGEVFRVANGFATFVSVGEDYKPVDLSFSLVPATEEEKVRHIGAQFRRKERLKMRDQLLSMASKNPSLDKNMHCDAKDETSVLHP